MNIPYPHPPTDSLYKFLSIFGCIIVVVSVYYPLHLLDIYKDKASTLRIEFNKAKVEQEKRKELIDEIEILRARGKYKDSVDLRNKLNNHLRESSIRSYEMNSMLKDIERHGNNALYATIASIIFILLGLIMAFLGFKKWYYKIQIYQDKILESQAKNINSNSD